MGFIDTDHKKTKKPYKSIPTDNGERSVITDQNKTSVITDQNKTSVVTDQNKTSVITDQQIKKMKRLYKKAKQTKNGHFIKCPTCELSYTKTRNKIFCSHSRNKRDDGGNCSDEYHNAINPDRQKALANKRRKQGRKANA